MPVKFKNLLLLPCALMPLFLLGQALDPRMCVEGGTADLPFSATMPDEARDGILKFYSAFNFHLDDAWAAKALREQLQAQRSAIEAQDPQYFSHLDDHIKELTAEAQKIVNADLNDQMAASLRHVMDLLKTQLEKDKPTLRLRGEFRYESRSRDPAVPGWTNPPEVSVNNGSRFEFVGGAYMDRPVAVSVPGAKIALPIKAHADLTMSTSYDVEGANANTSEPGSPETPVGATPNLKIVSLMNLSSANGSLGGNGSLTSWGCTWSSMFPRAKGTLRADPKTKG